MDTDACYQVVLPYVAGRRFSVSFSVDNDRTPSECVELERSIDTVWFKRKAENNSLFNASKFRLARASITAERVILHLGLTDYKTYLATHAPPQPIQRFGAACMAMPLGNVVIPVTRDQCTFVLVRSSHSAEGRFKCVFPGGHAEPSEVRHMTYGDCPNIRRELTASARREALEELFLDDHLVEKADDMIFLGMVRRTADLKASMIFCVQVLCDASQVEGRYWARNTKQQESVNLFTCALRRIVDAGVESVLPDGYCAMPELLGAAELYTQMQKSVPAERE